MYYRLLYISSAKKPLAPAELDGILRKSRRNNAAADISGLLIVGGRRFLQVLEGPEMAITETFERIRLDPRHYAIVSLAREPIEARSFGAWSMGYAQGGVSHGTGSGAVASMIAPIEDATLRAYFDGFVQVHAAA